MVPRVQMALQGWQKLSPSRQRSPWPTGLVYAACFLMIEWGRSDLALLTVLVLDTYLRPGEGAALTTDSVVEPAMTLGPDYRFASLLVHPHAIGRPSKTVQFDESLILNTKSRPWLGALVVAQKRRRGPGRLLVETTLLEWSRMFKACAHTLGVEEAPLHVLRHSGASEDHLRGLRPLDEIRKRGRWAAEASVRRYEKSARALHQAAKLPNHLQAHCRRCELVAPHVFAKQMPAPRFHGNLMTAK